MEALLNLPIICHYWKNLSQEFSVADLGNSFICFLVTIWKLGSRNNYIWTDIYLKVDIWLYNTHYKYLVVILIKNGYHFLEAINFNKNLFIFKF